MTNVNDDPLLMIVNQERMREETDLNGIGGLICIITSVYSNVKNPILLGEIFAGKLGLAFEAVLIATPSVDSFFLLRNVLDFLFYF